MSRIGKKPILIPENVDVKIEDNRVVVKGPKGEITEEILPGIKVELKEKEIIVSPSKISGKKTKASWGLARALIFNMIKGVVDGYEKKLQIEGVGYKARVEGEKLILQLGFSHPVEMNQPEGIKFSVEKNIIIVSGIDKELVGLIAARIRSIRPPEPYKGKGIRYEGEVIRRKAGKKVVAAGS